MIKKKTLFSLAQRLVPKENTEHGFGVWSGGKGNGSSGARGSSCESVSTVLVV